MSSVRYPAEWRVETLTASHKRESARSGQAAVDRWLKESALQSQAKHLSVTKVLLDDRRRIVGYYSLATSQVDFTDLPTDLVKRLPRRKLPVAVLAWLGVDVATQKQGLGSRLLATALRDAFDASQRFPFVVILLDCVDEPTKDFYQRFDFAELPGRPMRLYLPFKLLEQLLQLR